MIAAAWVLATVYGAALGAPLPYRWSLPPGFPVPSVPVDNPMTVAKVALGERLFSDVRLSVTGRYSCASCHRPALAFTDGRIRAVGATGDTLQHQSMSLVNAAYGVSFGWTDAGFDSLEAQMRRPLFNQHPVELGLRGREAALLHELSGRNLAVESDLDASQHPEFADGRRLRRLVELAEVHGWQSPACAAFCRELAKRLR